jgi:predicted DNA binding CopG/RHH family protein
MANMDKALKISVSIPQSVVEAIKKRAKLEGRTFSNMVTLILREAENKKAA